MGGGNANLGASSGEKFKLTLAIFACGVGTIGPAMRSNMTDGRNFSHKWIMWLALFLTHGSNWQWCFRSTRRRQGMSELGNRGVAAGARVRK